MNIYKAPFKMTAQKKTVYIAKKASERTLWSNRSAKDGPLQKEGITTEKARLCLVVVRAKGAIRKSRSVDRRERQSGIPKVVQLRSRR